MLSYRTPGSLLESRGGSLLESAEEYVLGPDSERQPGVPQGKVTKHEWNTSKIYPGTVRDYWVYVPAQYKPERPACTMVFQDGLADINVYSNYELGAALRDANYDYKLVIGTEGHNSKHGSAILPDALRWLWRDYPKPIVKPTGGPRHFINNNIVPDSDRGWELVSQGHKFTDGPAVDGAGNIFFSDIRNSRIHKVSADGTVTVFREDTAGASGLMFGPDGRLYASQSSRKRIVAFATDGKESVIAEDVNSNDLAINARGEIYFTDPQHRRIWLIDANRNRRIVHEGILFPNGVRFSPDHAFLMVADTLSRWIWSFSVAPDGSLTNGVPFHRLEIPDEVESGPLQSGADGMTVDADGFLYVATNLGIQIADPAGRTVGILNKPDRGDPSSVAFGSADLQTLYVTSGDKVFRRPIKRKGTLPWVATMPPKPRL